MHANAQCMHQAGAETHPLKGPLTLVFALRQVMLTVVPVAIRSEVGVVLGAPLAVVNAVDDAAQLPAVLPQAPVQAPAALLRLAFPGIPACMAQARRMRAPIVVKGRCWHILPLKQLGYSRDEQS